jgi:MFS family permease
MIECREWEYNMTDGLGNTWNSQWNLVCDKKYLKIVAEMIFLIGVATGGIISGMLSDKFGRKKMLFISAVFQSFFGKYLSGGPRCLHEFYGFSFPLSALQVSRCSSWNHSRYIWSCERSWESRPCL